MGNFNRGRSGGGGFGRRGFHDRGSRGPVQMHSAVCDNCRQNCEVPFRPTNGKPVYCSNCFDRNRNSDTPGFEGKNHEEKRMFEAICDECGNGCKVPFQPSGEKPVYCSNCFGEKKGADDKNNESLRPQYTNQFAELNNKLDKILIMLAPKNDFAPAVKIEEEITEEAPKKKPAKKK